MNPPLPGFPGGIPEFVARLEALKAELTAKGPKRLDPGRSDPVERVDEDGAPLTEMLNSIASSQNRTQLEVLRRIDAALLRAEEEPELVGLCLDCEEPIAERRFVLMPYVEYCVACQAEHERPITKNRKHLMDFDAD